MPLPYPAVFKAEKSMSDVEKAEDRSFQNAVNLVVLLLNWLHLRRPPTAPQEILLGTPLSSLQWRSVRLMEQAMEACKVSLPVAASDMGRTACKIEELEGALDLLQEFEQAAASNLLGGYESRVKFWVH